jgi:two-component system, OmpR family, sensor histidine kinase VicK
MFESVIGVPLHFTVEFLGFLVAAGGAILALTRRSLVPGAASNRITVATGFGILALAQVLHGGAFQLGEYTFDSDGTQILIGARAVAMAFVFVGISGGLRAGMPAGAVLGLREPLLLAPAAASLLVAASALIGSFKNGPRAYRRLSLGALLLAVSELLTAYDPNASFGDQTASGVAYTSHSLKLAGYLALAAWLWSAVRSSIRTRFVASFAALLVMVVLALSSTLTGVLSKNVEAEKLRQLELQLSNVLNEIEQETLRDLADQVQVVTTLPSSVQVPIARGDDLDRLAEDITGDLEFLEFLDFDFVMIMDPGGRILGFHLTERLEGGPRRLSRIDVLNIAGTQVVEEVVRGISPFAATPVRIGDRYVANMAVRQVEDPAVGGRVAGILAAGRFINRADMEEFSNRLAAHVSLVIDRRLLASKLPRGLDLQGERLVPREVETQVGIGDTVVTTQHLIDGRAFFSAFANINSRGGGPVATLILSSGADTIVAARESLTRILFLVALGVGAIALVLAYFFGRRITRPIQALTETASAVRSGDLSAQAIVAGDDEVGRLGETFNDMTRSLFKMTNDLRGAAREEHRLRARIETIIQSMADGLVATDANHKVLAFNREAELLTGLKPKHAIGKPVDEVLRACDANGQRVPLPIFELAGGSVDNIFLEKRNGQRTPVAVVSAVLTAEEGDVAGGVAVLRDMSREREVERMKSEFLANISHELRTPLTPIKGYAEILGRKEVPPEKVKKFVGGILEGTSRLERIIQLLVDFSAMEAGRLAPRNKPVHIGEIVEQLAGTWDAKTTTHSIIAEVGDGLPLVSGDERLIKRALEEVVDNAVKFSPQGGTIRLEARATGAKAGERRHRRVEVTISDEGIGIPPEDLPKIFSDFHQLDGSETRSYGGLGLGLAFVERIVEAHGGRVSVESQLDEGTRLTIKLPAEMRAHKVEAHTPPPEGGAEPTEGEDEEQERGTGPVAVPGN